MKGKWFGFCVWVGRLGRGTALGNSKEELFSLWLSDLFYNFPSDTGSSD